MKYIKSLFSVLLALIAIDTFAGDTAAAKIVNRDLKITSWNIYMLPPIVPMKGRLERAAAIVDTLSHSETDIIVFQEAFHHGAVSIIREGLKNVYPYMYGPFNPQHSPFRISSGVFVISKVPLDLKGTIEYKIAREDDKVAKKGAALLEGTWNGKRFQIIGTHLQAQNQPKVRSIQIHHMFDSLMAKYKVEGVPQIVCGDMNTEIEIEKNYKDMLATLDAEDGEMSGIQKMTYDGTNNELALSVWKYAKTSLDYILLRKNGATCSVTDRHVGVYKRAYRKGRHDLSDHYAVVCEVKFDSPAPVVGKP
jgi:endonuclease/exonuclease/phosphatase family metal-dependent hydrolase